MFIRYAMKPRITMLFTLLAFGPLLLATAFNVDVDSKVVHQGPTGSCDRDTCQFGFSVAQHRDKGTPW